MLPEGYWKGTPATTEDREDTRAATACKGQLCHREDRGLEWLQALTLLPKTQLHQGGVKGTKAECWGWE